jgi:hypothetical protein
MQLTVTIGGIVHTPLYEGFRMERDLGSGIGTASLIIVQDARLSKVGSAKVGTAKVSWNPPPAAEITIADSGGTLHFGGYVAQQTPIKYSETETAYALQCQDYTCLLDRTYITSESYTAQTDIAIISDLFTTYLPEIDLSLVLTSLATIATLELDGASLRDAMDRICALTGGEWHLGPDKKLRYLALTGTAAPWGFSDTPDNATTFEYNREPRHSKEWPTPANRVTVVGKLDTGGVNITATAEDALSQRIYGRIYSRTIVDRQIQSAAEALLRAQAEVARYAWPDESITLTHRKDGLDVGMAVPYKNIVHGCNGTYLLRRIVIEQLTDTITQYTCELGDWKPDLLKLQRRLGQLVLLQRDPANRPQAVSPDNTVDSDQITLGAVQDQHFDRISGNKIRVTNADIVSLQASKITAGTLDVGVVYAGTIDANKINAGTLGVGVVYAGTIAADKITAGTLDVGVVYAGTIAADKITAGTLGAGVIYAGTLAVDKITGWAGSTITVSGANFEIAGTAQVRIACGGGLYVSGATGMYDDLMVNANIEAVGGYIKASGGGVFHCSVGGTDYGGVSEDVTVGGVVLHYKGGIYTGHS